MGLVPTFPVTSEPGTSVIPDFDRMTKYPAPPRFTAAVGAAGSAARASGAERRTAGSTGRKRSSAAPKADLTIIESLHGDVSLPSFRRKPARAAEDRAKCQAEIAGWQRMLRGPRMASSRKADILPTVVTRRDDGRRIFRVNSLGAGIRRCDIARSR